MAVSKLWPVTVRLATVLDYASNPEKTTKSKSKYSNADYQALRDVVAYAKDGEKTERELFCEGIHCNPQTAREQFITVKEQFDKPDGIQAYHGYLSFEETDITPELAQQVGMAFAERMWGDRFQVLVTTHLNTEHLHCHFVVNSVSFRDGKRLQNKEKAWWYFRHIADEVCLEHGLSVVQNPEAYLSFNAVVCSRLLSSLRSAGGRAELCNGSGIKLLKGFNDLKTKYPSLAAEWSEKNLSLTPDAVNEKSTKNVWWKCNTCGYEWKAVVKARVKGGMCPVCAERAVLQGYNDLGTTDPFLLSEWDYEKNSKWTPSNVSRNSMKVVWWKCGAGHSYRAKITDRTIEQKGCPQCEAEFQQALPQMLIMMYGAQNGITVKSNSDSELGMRLVAYLPELHCAVDIAGATVTEKREQSVKAHICQSNRLGYYLIKRTADTSQMAAEIKTLFIRNHIYLHTDSEKDVQVLRERFLEWKNRNACKLNGKY